MSSVYTDSCCNGMSDQAGKINTKKSYKSDLELYLKQLYDGWFERWVVIISGHTVTREDVPYLCM